MSFASTLDDLRRWGYAGRGRGFGYPKMAAFMKIRTGYGIGAIEESDPVADQIEKIVCKAPDDIQELLIAFYVANHSVRHLARIKDVSKYRMGKLLEEAQWYVHTELENIGHVQPLKVVNR